MTEKDIFAYDNGEEVTKGAFRISASQLSKFFDNTSKWYHENLLGEEGFTGNTATKLGTVVHAGIETYVKNGEVDWQALEDHIVAIDDPEIDVAHIFNQYAHMINAALPYVEANMPDEVEKFIFQEIIPGIGAGGSLDAIKDLNSPYGATIMDWKTTGAKTAPTKFSRSYWFQQMCYAWVLAQQGVKVQYIKLVYITQSDVNRFSEKTGKALKDYPSVVTEVTEEVTKEGLALIGSCLELIAESVDTWNTQPELRHLLAQDNRLKPAKAPKLFPTGR